MLDFERALSETEDFLSRQLGSRAAREASKRKFERGIGEAMRRVRRSGLVFVLLLFALILYSLVVAPIGFFTWLVALPTVFLASLMMLLWPTRRSRQRRTAAPREPVALDRLAGEAEEWLLDRCRELPRASLPAVDQIINRLRELQPNLAALPPSSPLAGDTQRLVGQHLPRLVDTFLELPPASRVPGTESSERLTESLGIVADELTRISSDVASQRSLGFDAQHRFIETRYGNDDGFAR